MDLKKDNYSPFSEMIRNKARKHVTFLEEDRPIYKDMDKMQLIMRDFAEEIMKDLFY